MTETPSYLPSMGRLLNTLSEAACNLAEDYLRPHDISLAQWVVLSALWRQDGLNVSELSEYSSKKTAALSRLLDRMESKGLVSRSAVEDDKRSVKIHLTEKGQGLSHLIDMYKHVNGILLSDLTETEKEQLLPMLERMLKSVQVKSRKS
ncbi:Multiple antibiotic resistance protein MarR [Pseudovibrio sp. Ad46]|uniref:MarR family winged helix-turn-helix transcriptional regulator n=1 Tax=unclassified Pseudovibrio TaxID=2627060 RepID=UPI0007AE52D0|nr:MULTISPECIES: MarR family transcriptional regulator [unclassified Pseudovibrio]KZK96279.1 Multiple antibiotic resistance protein MarR [Pseudovibrio sp. Ad46]KZL00908.1 Multiple antibiotic resistance protein MarR [Pseudovibrio sp. Ad5]KZL20278.1 Multiple antibiotic resistance protein MarR [Pseudovibrio sp. WM33]